MINNIHRDDDRWVDKFNQDKSDKKTVELIRLDTKVTLLTKENEQLKTILETTRNELLSRERRLTIQHDQHERKAKAWFKLQDQYMNDIKRLESELADAIAIIKNLEP